MMHSPPPPIGRQWLQSFFSRVTAVLGSELLGYILKRVLEGFLTLLLASLLTFYIVDLAPGDYLDQFKNNPQMSQERLEELRQEFGLGTTWGDRTLVSTLKTPNTDISAIALSPDGNLVVSGGAKEVKLWEAAGTFLKTLPGHQGSITALAFSGDGEIFASGSADKTIRLWQKNGRLLKTLSGHSAKITALAFSGDGEIFASGSADKTIRLWDTKGTLLKTLTGHQGEITTVTFSPDSETLASGSTDKTAKLWTIEGTLLHTFNHGAVVTAVQFNKNQEGPTLNTVANQQTLLTWSFAGKQLTSQDLRQLPQQPQPITMVQFSSDRETFITSTDRTLRLWSLKESKALGTIQGRAALLQVQVADNGERLALINADQSVQIWQKDRSLIKQYGLWLQNILTFDFSEIWKGNWRQVYQGDFGESFTYQRPVTDLIWERVPNTLLLALASLVVNWGIAIPLGIIGAVNQDGWSDRSLRVLSYLGQGFPSFITALLLLFLAQSTPLFPVGDMTSIDHADLNGVGKVLDVAWHMILPTLALSISGFAGLQRITRGNLLDVLRQNYIQTARAKGLPEHKVIYVHALRNAVNPLITLLGFEFSSLLGGAFIAEFFFNWPGLGQLLLKAVQAQDLYLVMAGLMMGAVMLIVGNLLADILLAVVDPRIKLSNFN
jgi:peptide/nickel transport system permease protein